MYQDLGCVVSSSRDLEGGGGGARGRRRGVTDNLKRMGLDIGDEVWCVGVGVDSRPIIMRKKKKITSRPKAASSPQPNGRVRGGCTRLNYRVRPMSETYLTKFDQIKTNNTLDISLSNRTTNRVSNILY